MNIEYKKINIICEEHGAQNYFRPLTYTEVKMKEITTKAVVTVIGKDMVGILAKVSTACAEKNANVIEVTQSVLDGYFCMVMILDITESTCQIDELQGHVKSRVPDMVVHAMHEDIFNSMHRI